MKETNTKEAPRPTYTFDKDRIGTTSAGNKVIEHFLGRPYQMDYDTWKKWAGEIVALLNGAGQPAPINMMVNGKPETPAEEYIRERRMRYATGYPTDFHLILRMCSTADDDWNKDGLIHCTYNERKMPYDLTLDGWDSARNVSRCPVSWPMPLAGSPIFNIPDNAHESWLQEIGMFCYHLEQWMPIDVREMIRATCKLNGLSVEYQNSSNQRNIDGYTAIRKAVMETYDVRGRIRTIQEERANKNRPPKPLVVEVGATVRFLTGSKTAVVEEIIKVPGCQDRCGANIVRLDQEINGSAFHDYPNLVPLEAPKKP